MANIIYVSDMDITGSGYMNISVPLCLGLVEKGHSIIVLGLGYKRDEHNFPFRLIPAKDFAEVVVMIHNLKVLWKPDIVVASLDIPWHEIVLRNMLQKQVILPYVGIFPVESDPLCLEWAMALMQMTRQFAISQFGADECQKMGVPAEHLQIGVDTESWRFPTAEERKALREASGFNEDDFVILTVADNQERKNLGRALQSISCLKGQISAPIRYVMVTREHNSQGFRLRSLASRSDINVNTIFDIFERGMTFAQLWGMYAIADCFFLPSKAEGLGMPLLEAMSVGVPCVATDCAGMHELLSDGRGILLKPEVVYPDVFGNGNRYMISAEEGARGILYSMNNPLREQIIPKARAYVENRHWQIPVDQLDETIRGILK